MNKLALSAVIFMAACGGGDKPKGMVDTASARQSVDQVVAVNAAMMTSDGNAAASAVQSMTNAGQSIVSPSAMGRLAPVGLLPDSFPKNLGGSATTGTAECTATGCTFTNYGDDVGGWSIDGTINRSGDTTTFDLDYHVVSAGTAYDWTIDGSVTLTETSIDGSVHSHGVTDVDSGSGGQFNVTWDTNVEYNAIVLTAGCPTAGSIHAEVSYDVSGAQGGGNYSAQGDATFGPACGDATAS